MAKIGILTAPAIGHLFPLFNLSFELQKRGHKIFFFNIKDVEDITLKNGFHFHCVGEQFIPQGAMNSLQEQIGEMGGMTAMKTWQENNKKLIQVMFWSLPKALSDEKPDFLIVDQSDAAGATVAEYLQIPFVTVIIGNSMKWEKHLPPVFSAWNFSEEDNVIKRNIEAQEKVLYVLKPIRDVINSFRAKWNLSEFTEMSDLFPVSDKAEIAQIPEFLDLPRKERRDNYFMTGPFRSDKKSEIPFPFHLLTGKPMIYASLGTVVNHRKQIFTEIAQACSELDVQLVISAGNQKNADSLIDLPGCPVVVPFAPQFDVLKHAKLCITHAGLNTVMDALENGVPLLAIPISFDQPGTGVRIKHHRVGDIVSLNNISVENHLKEKLFEVYHNNEFRENAEICAQKMKSLNGSKTAADIIERYL